MGDNFSSISHKIPHLFYKQTNLAILNLNTYLKKNNVFITAHNIVG